MSKVISWGSRVLAVICFIYPLFYLSNKFSKVRVVEATTTTVLPLPILIVISVIGLVLIIGGGTSLLIQYGKQAAKNPFSFIVLLPFGLIILGFVWFARIWTNKISLLIETNATQFIDNLSDYTYALGVVGIWYIVGLLIGITGVIYNYIEQYKA